MICRLTRQRISTHTDDPSITSVQDNPIRYQSKECAVGGLGMMNLEFGVGSWESGVGSWESGVGSWELGHIMQWRGAVRVKTETNPSITRQTAPMPTGPAGPATGLQLSYCLGVRS